MRVRFLIYFTKHKSNCLQAFYKTAVLEILVKTQEHTRDGVLCKLSFRTFHNFIKVGPYLGFFPEYFPKYLEQLFLYNTSRWCLPDLHMSTEK